MESCIALAHLRESRRRVQARAGACAKSGRVCACRYEAVVEVWLEAEHRSTISCEDGTRAAQKKSDCSQTVISGRCAIAPPNIKR